MLGWWARRPFWASKFGTSTRLVLPSSRRWVNSLWSGCPRPYRAGGSPPTRVSGIGRDCSGRRRPVGMFPTRVASNWTARDQSSAVLGSRRGSKVIVLRVGSSNERQSPLLRRRPTPRRLPRATARELAIATPTPAPIAIPTPTVRPGTTHATSAPTPAATTTTTYNHTDRTASVCAIETHRPRTIWSHTHRKPFHKRKDDRAHGGESLTGPFHGVARDR